MQLKTVIRGVLGHRFETALRRSGRIRFVNKAKYVMGGDGFRAHPLEALAFVALSPEFDNFAYALANEDELAEYLAATLGGDVEVMRGYLAEPSRDERLVLASQGGWAARRHRGEAILGRRAAWYAAVRALGPSLVVETGVQDGLGSLCVLSALERNAAEGRPGRLISIDPLPSAGHLVPAELREDWRLIHEGSEAALAGMDAGTRVDLLLQDSGGDEDRALAELRLVDAMGVRVVLSGNQRLALARVAEGMGMRYSEHAHVPTHPIVRGDTTGIGVRVP